MKKSILSRFTSILLVMIMILTSVTSVFAGTYESVLYGGSDGKLKDGIYEASMTWGMASGETSRRNFTLPDTVEVRGGQAYAVIGVDSVTYDYAKVGEKQYEVTATGDKYSTFEIPVAINQDMEVILHSTSMDTEIKYIANVTADIPQADEKTPEEAAMAWIQENCIDGNIFSQCSEAYVKVISKDGDTYDLAYRSATNATIKKNVKLSRPDSSEFKSGWHFDDPTWVNKYKPTNQTYEFARPSKVFPMKATLKLYAPETADADINDDSAEALAEYTFTINIMPKQKSYSISLNTVDTLGNAIEGVAYEVKDNYDNPVTVSADGKCTLCDDRSYSISAKAQGYKAEDGSEAAQVENYTPTKAEAIELKLKKDSQAGETELEDGTYEIEASTDSSMFRFVDTKLIVENGMMYAVVTMSGDGFDRIYMGDAEYASEAPAEEDTICYADSKETAYKGNHVFWPIPVSELDKTIKVSGRSAKKGTWYDHDLVFDSKTLKKVSDEVLWPDDSMEAEKLMTQFYKDGNVVVKNGDAVIKSGSEYTIPYYESDGKTQLESITLKRPDQSDFKSGWVFSLEDKEDSKWFTEETLAGLSKPADDQTYTLTTQRPQDPVTVKATLSLYSADTADSAINDGTASALTQLSVSFVISAKPASYEIKLEAVDSVTGDDISDAAITMKDRFGNLIEADGEGKYQVNSEMTYTVTASKEGYVGQGGADEYTYTFTPAKDETIQLPLTQTDDGKSVVKFEFKDQKGNLIDSSLVTIQIKDADKNVVDPESDGSYILWNDAKYSYTIEAYGYYSASSTNFKVSEDGTVSIVLTEKIKIYKATITAKSFDTGEALAADIKVMGTKNGVQTEVTPNQDGTYDLDWETDYVITIIAEGYKTRVYEYKPSGNNEEVNLNLALSLSAENQLKKAIKETEEYMAEVAEGDGSLEYPEGTLDAIKAAIDAAGEVLNKAGVTEEELSDAKTALDNAVRAIKKTQNPQIMDVPVRYQTEVNGVTVQKTLTVRGDAARKAGYLVSDKNVTVLDVIVTLHQELYGDDFKNDPEKYLQETSGIISRIFGMKGGSFDYRIDHKLHDFVIGDVRMDEGEVLAIYPCEDNSSYTKEEYLYFDETSVKSEEGEDLVLILKGAAKDEKEPAPKEGYTITLKNEETGDLITAVSDKDGRLIFKGMLKGEYTVVSAEKEGVKHVALPYAQITVTEKAEEPEAPVYSVGVTVTDSKTGAAIEDAVIKVTDKDGAQVSQDGSGKYLLKADAEYKIEVSAPGYEGPDGEASLTKVFVPSEDSTLVFSLEKVNEDKNPSEGTDEGDSDNAETGDGTGDKVQADSNIPKTADETQMAAWMLAALLSLAGGSVLMRRKGEDTK